jgi:hypothetical protein
MKAILTVVAILATTSPASATLLFYDGFEYPASTPTPGANNGSLPGNTNAAYGGTWTVASAPVGGASPSTQQNVVVGSVEYPHPSQQPSPGNVAQVNRAASLKNLATSINIPGGPITSGSIFFSFTMELRSWTNLNATQSRQGTNWWGGMIAGFHGLPEGGNMSPTTNYGTQVRLLRYVDQTQNATTTVQAQRYHIGVAKNLPAGSPGPNWNGATTSNTPATDTSDINSTFVVGNEVFIVGEYKIVPGPDNDETRIWVNPPAGDLSQYTTPTVPVVNAYSGVPDPTSGGIASFFFFSDTQTAGNTWIDEVRIGTTYADVVPVPEPSALALTGLGLAVAGWRRRTR